MNEHPLLTPRQRLGLSALAALGACAFLAGVRLHPQRAWAALLIGNVYFLSLAALGAVFVATHRVATAGWPTVFRRVPEAMTAYLPAGFALMGGLLFGLPELYPWADRALAGHDPLIRGKAALLNVPAFAAVTALCVGAWWLFARALVAGSRAQDERGELAHTARGVRLSAVFLVVFAVTFSLAAIVWLMSLEPHWYSTIYPWFVFSSALVNGVAWITLLLLALRRRGHFEQVNAHHLHDLGKYLFAFSVFWGYLWFSQYLLVWYSNLPEETSHYVARLAPGWRAWFWANPLLNVALPFFLLLRARDKRREARLLQAAAALALGHALDFYLLVGPALAPRPELGWLEAGIWLSLTALFLLLFDRAAGTAALVPLRDPYLVESVQHRG